MRVLAHHSEIGRMRSVIEPVSDDHDPQIPLGNQIDAAEKQADRARENDAVDLKKLS
jgi:hypothetical protein